MAAGSENDTWASILKLKGMFSKKGDAVTQNDFMTVLKAIDVSREKFAAVPVTELYARLAVVLADFIIRNAANLSITHLDSTVQACRVLMPSLLHTLKEKPNSEEARNEAALDADCAVKALGSLCRGCSSLTESELSNLELKLTNLTLKTSTAAEVPRSVRAEFSSTLLDQFTAAIPGPLFVASDTVAKPSSQAGQDISQSQSLKLLCKKNILSLQSLQAGESLVQFALNLPHLQAYIQKWDTAVETTYVALPSQSHDALSVRLSLAHLRADVELVKQALDLPVFEPLDDARIKGLARIAAGCLLSSLTVASAASILAVCNNSQAVKSNSNLTPTTKDEELDLCAVAVTEGGVEVFRRAIKLVQDSPFAGRHIGENLLFQGAWLLLSGLQTQLNNTSQSSDKGGKEDKGKSPGKHKDSGRINLTKVQQGFSSLSVMLTSQGLALLESLLELPTPEIEVDVDQVKTAELNVLSHSSHAERMLMLFKNIPIPQLLFHIATVSYRKSCNLKRIQRTDGETASVSDSATFYDDEFSSSEESSAAEDDDSEPILGQWFEKTITPPEPKTDKTTHAENDDHEQRAPKTLPEKAQDISTTVPDKQEPHGYIVLATQIFAFMNDHLLWASSSVIQKYSVLGEQQLALLAAITKDLDHETARTETGTISMFFGAALGELYVRFSHALARFTHNLLAGCMLDFDLQVALLSHLNINPWSDEEDWPLLVFPRSLTILAQVLLSKQKKEKEDVRALSESACFSIWRRVLATIVKLIQNPAADHEGADDDLNVEHAQLLLFLFHSLLLMQKKSVLLLCAQSIVQVTQNGFTEKPLEDSQLMLLARLLLLLEYLVKNLYDAPPVILEQVQWNLLSVTGLNSQSTTQAKDFAQQASRIYSAFKELEDNYRKFGPGEDGGFTPKFYHLSNLDSNNQDLPKLDGLASNFLLTPSESFKYASLYDSLLGVLNVVNQCDLRTSRNDKRDYSLVCSVQYCFSVAWRLVQSLPPSVNIMGLLAAEEVITDKAVLLHSLLWGPRSAHKVYSAWIKDSLVKQGLTTLKAGTIVEAVAKHVSNSSVLVKLAKQLAKAMGRDEAASPTLWDIVVMDVVVARLQTLYDEHATRDNGHETYRVLESPTDKLLKSSKIAKDVFMGVCELVELVANLSRRCVLNDAIGSSTDTPTSEGFSEAEALQHLLAVTSSRGCTFANINPALTSCLPPFLRAALDRWNSSALDFPSAGSWRNLLPGDLVPFESYLSGVLSSHLNLLSCQAVFSPAPSLRHLLSCCVRLANDLVVWYPDTDSGEKELVRVFFPMVLDSCFVSIADLIQLVLERIIGSSDSGNYQDIASYIVIEHCHALLTITGQMRCLEEKALEECIRFMESCIDNSSRRHPLARFYTSSDEPHSLWSVVFSTTAHDMTPAYSKMVCKFINKFLKTTEPSEIDLENLALSLLSLSCVDETRLEAWVEHAVSSTSSICDVSLETAKETPDQEMSVLQNLTQFALRKGDSSAEEFAMTVLPMMLKVITKTADCSVVTPQLVSVMINLASICKGQGHLQLFTATINCILLMEKQLEKESWKNLDSEDLAKPPPLLASLCCLLQYAADIVGAMKAMNESDHAESDGKEESEPSSSRSVSPSADADPDWDENLVMEDVDSEGDESDEDLLCNKLCTYSVTQKEFMNQHWYHCHTCRMVDGVGVCTVCAKVCHRDHDVTYAKFGSFFCDCGAKEDGSCQALTRRPSQVEEELKLKSSTQTSQQEAAVFATKVDAPYLVDTDSETSLEPREKYRQLMLQLEPFRDELLSVTESSKIISCIVRIFNVLGPAIEKASKDLSPIGSLQRARKALEDLHVIPKSINVCESLMIPTLGSQEGAFENVRMSFAGDQGQTIRQLLSAHVLRRVSMCCLASPQGKRQHLAMSHEKGKVTFLQLSSLLKQADASKRKLTLTRLSSAPVPFTVLSMASNPANEDVIAVCGLKECHVLTLSSGGNVLEHLALHPQLETGNFVIKAVWLPGSPTQLAVVTADFIKIYYLDVDALSPQYYFLLPTGKIRDCTFFFRQDGAKFVFFISSSGYVYWQALCEESSARHGPFYVTNVLDITHPDVKETNGQTGGGGVSIYFSHCMQLLCFSYLQGRTFFTSVRENSRNELEVGPLHQVVIPSKSSAGGSGALKLSSGQGSSGSQQPLCQWTEVPGHPGLFLTFTQSSYVPVVIMVEPNNIMVEELKIIPSKVKVTDMVAVRHSVSNGGSLGKNEQRTTLILLCDDGSLRIFMASPELTSYWLSPTLQPPNCGIPVKFVRKEVTGGKSVDSSNPVFPVDFFEHCQPLNDVEFGGTDLLHIYNAAQLKHRLNTTGLYIACPRQQGFALEITNPEGTSVITGFRVLVGTQDVQKAPNSVEVFGRGVPFVVQRYRWFDVPLTREESLQADKKLVLNFGPSNDPTGITMIDSVKVYGKTKEAFGWPEEPDDVPATAVYSPSTQAPFDWYTEDRKVILQTPAQVTLDKLVEGLTGFLEGTIAVLENDAEKEALRQHIMEHATGLLTLPWNPSSNVPETVKGLLSGLYKNSDEFHKFKDTVLLKALLTNLKEIHRENSPIYLDPEAYYSVLSSAKSIALARPENVISFAAESAKDFPAELMETGQLLHRVRAVNQLLSPVGQLGLSQIGYAVQLLVDIFKAIAVVGKTNVADIADHFITMLLCEDPVVSHAVKVALQRSLKLPSDLDEKSADSADEGSKTKTVKSTESKVQGLKKLRFTLMGKLSKCLPELKTKGGLKSIHFLQVLLFLVSELQPTDPVEKAELYSVLTRAVSELNLAREAAQEVAGQRTPQHEIQLLIMKFFVYLLSSTKAKSRSKRTSYLAMIAARVLLEAGLMQRCLALLQAILQHWKSASVEDNPVSTGLLKAPPAAVMYDLAPFFSHSPNSVETNPFEGFSQLLTEMTLRLPYLVKKIDSSVQLDPSWVECLCEYVAAPTPSAVKRHVRKLLLFHCGSKELYRQVRDIHSLKTWSAKVKKIVLEHGFEAAKEGSPDGLVLPYDELVNIMENLKNCLEIATSRTGNWQMFCEEEEWIVAFLIELSCFIDEGICATLLQLLRHALCPAKSTLQESQSAESRRKTEEIFDIDSCCGPRCKCGVFVQLVHKTVDRRLLTRFIFRFLLDCGTTSMRWHAHALILSVYRHSIPAQQQQLVSLMWSLWSGLQLYGRKAAQFVDLLGFFSIKTTGFEAAFPQYIDQAVALLKEENRLLLRHPNASLYNSLAGLVQLDGYYLERDPCLVCSTVELPFAPIKLTTLKSDVRFTTTTQIIKLVSSHVINRFSVKITDVKRTKMVQTIGIYYNNRPVQAAVELKNRPGAWHKAKKINLTPGQTEVKIDLPLPITACNLKIEFSSFFENLTASSEMLQCPRCSASVPAHPGVCSNCGENVYQCHKCRAINYDEKDPFLCNSCGFCKYAKFDITLVAKPCSTVEPVENEEDRKKALQTINALLEKADRLQTQLLYAKETVELLLNKLGDSSTGEGTSDENGPAAVSTPANPPNVFHINRTIQQISQRYNVECKSTCEELTKIAQRVTACRREIVSYDANQRQKAVKRSAASGDDATFIPLPTGVSNCYGCTCAALDHCLTLLRAIATKPTLRRLMFEQGLLHELLQHNLNHGSPQTKNEVRDLLCLLTYNTPDAVDCLNLKLTESVNAVIKRSTVSMALLNSVRNEMALLSTSVQCQDSCWEKRLRCVIQLFMKSTQYLAAPAVMDFITLPCLRMIEDLIQGSLTGSITSAKERKRGDVEVHVDLKRWLRGDPLHSFDSWKTRLLPRYDLPVSGKRPKEVRQIHLLQKFVTRWREKVIRRQPITYQLSGHNWLQAMLFNPNSRLSRQTACVFLDGLARVPQRRQEVVDLLTGFLPKIGEAGPYGAEYVTLYQSLIRKDHWRFYLVCRGLLPQLAGLIEAEISVLSRQENAGRSSELSQGHALKALVELMAFLMEDSRVRQSFKGQLVGNVLNGYLQLRRLVLQRTRLIEEAQELLLQLLGDMTTGNEAETRQFMAVCVQTLRQCRTDDLVTPVFVVERLCSIIHPEEKDDVEFLMTLDKDPQQEDFLQGRMQGNPYSSNEPGLGPLMRDVKNKICHDCELIALLEDDTGMELLVCNKIISLDLPVRDVFRKVWMAENSEQEPMKIVYRMRGLLGDATEEFIEQLDNKQQTQMNDEETYKMANVMAQCNGLEVLLERLNCVKDIHGEGRPLLGALVKLLSLCVKVEANRTVLIHPELKAIKRLLSALKLCFQLLPNPPPFTDQLLEVMEAILCRASKETVQSYAKFAATCGTIDDLKYLMQVSAQIAGSKQSAPLLARLTRVMPFLTFVEDDKMDAFIEHFRSCLNFSGYDTDQINEQALKLELFCSLTAGIEHNNVGNTLKDRLVASNVVQNAIEYLQAHAPSTAASVSRDSSEWKEFISKPSLKFVLRLLTGLAHSHETTQLALANESIPIFHHLEQISSDEHVGTLAENLLEAMRGHEQVAKRIEEVRQQTKAEKKRLAMAMREKQLGALGMRTNERGQVKAENAMLQQLVDLGLGEEPGLVCVICREGYRFQPNKVLAIYTFSRRCQLEDIETQLWHGTPPSSSRVRKTLGYYTVSHFNVVHVECHLAAVRLARARDEWESAALQNANTRCNGLLPLWGPQVPESNFVSCLARHNTYLQECTGHRDIGYSSTCHDIKLLLLRFALERSFSDESGGGGPQSNLHFLPYMIHVALYVLNTTRALAREEKNLTEFLDTPRGEKWISSALEPEGPFYSATLAVLILSPQRWRSSRMILLGRLLVAAHCRAVQQKAGRKEKEVLDYVFYKPALVFFALTNGLYDVVFKAVNPGSDAEWPIALADYIRHNDEAILRSTDKLLDAYQSDYLPCASFDEFCEVNGLLEDIPSPEAFIQDLVHMIP